VDDSTERRADDDSDHLPVQDPGQPAYQHLTCFLEGMLDPVLVASPEGTILAANSAAAKLAGYERDQLVGLRLDALLEQDLAPLAALLARQPVRNAEAALLAKSGERVPVVFDGSGVRGPDGLITALLVVARDVRQQRQAEVAIREALDYAQSIVDTLRDPLLVLDADLRVVSANRSFYDTFHLGPEETQGLFLHELGQRQWDIPRLRSMLEEVLLRGRAVENFEVEREFHGIGWRTLLLDARPILTAAGRPSRFLLTMRDITAQKLLEQQLRHAQRMEALARLTGGLAHDLNNTLTGIIGCASFVAATVKKDSPSGRDLERIRHLANRATGLVRRLLAFGRQQPLQPRVINLNRLMQDITDMLQRLIGEDITLEFLPAPNLGNVRADAAQMEQVLMNLAVNARDAMPRGGKLTLETANVELDFAYAERHVGVMPGPYVMLAITDTGVGMDQETQRHIFEPFFTTKDQERGTGLGLSQVYGIVKQHGGNIWVYSEPGKGTTFKIYLPRVDAPVEKSRSTQPRIGTDRGTETVLVVEDEEAVRRVVAASLAQKGYTVLTAASAAEAEEIFHRRGAEVALLITDVILPRRTGRELHRRLASRRPGLKVLYISGYPGNAVVRRGLVEPGTAFLQKPFTPDLLTRRVREVLDDL